MAGKSRALQFSWLDTLEAVGKVVKQLESVQVAAININLLLINKTHCHMFLQSEAGYGK